MYRMFTYEFGDQSEREIGLSHDFSTLNNLARDVESRELRWPHDLPPDRRGDATRARTIFAAASPQFNTQSILSEAENAS